MEHLLLAVIAILLTVIFALLGKIYLMHKATLEIGEAFEVKLAADTNTLIDISSRDPYLCRLAASINTQLRILRKQRHRYLVGDRELKEAVTNISHDLRTPLTAICGYLDLLQREPLSENAVRYISLIENRTEAMKQLTEELFRYSVILSTQELEIETVCLNGVLEESIAAFYAALTSRGIQPQIHMSGKRIEKQLNRDALSRVFSNILNNALKYSDGDLEITLRDDGEIVFANTASGLNEIQVGKLFDRFFTVEAARNLGGLGLAISKNIVDLMGGDLSVESAPGKGSRFTVRFELELGPEPEKDLGDERHLHILMADADEVCCRRVAADLEHMGHRADIALTGPGAAQRVIGCAREGAGYDWMLLNWDLPEANALQTLEAIRGALGDETPKCVFTAYDVAAVEKQGREAGARGFLTKPIFRSRLQTLLGQDSQGETGAAIEPMEALKGLALRGKRILLVEDNALNREIAAELLSVTGAEIETAENGREALNTVRSRPGEFDLVLMDIQMPVMNGYEAAQAIRALHRPDTDALPIVALTANAFDEDVLRSRKAGMNAHLSKPLDIRKLVETLRGLM